MSLRKLALVLGLSLLWAVPACGDDDDSGGTIDAAGGGAADAAGGGSIDAAGDPDAGAGDGDASVDG